MGRWSQQGGWAHKIQNYLPDGDNYFKNLNATTEDTKSAWVEESASTPVGGYLVPQIQPADITTDYLVDYGIGSAGNEIVILSNLYGATGNSAGYPHYGINWVIPIIPIYIPAGTRLVSRVQKHWGTATVKYLFSCALIVPASSFGSPQSLAFETTYGANTSDSGGTSIDPGGTAHTKGGWTELTASTTSRVKAMFIAFGNQRNTSRVDLAFWRVDIGIGGAGSEIAIIEDFSISHRLNARVLSPGFSHLFPVDIPAGTRISARCMCNQNTQRTIDVIIYCFS